MKTLNLLCLNDPTDCLKGLGHDKCECEVCKLLKLLSDTVTSSLPVGFGGVSLSMPFMASAANPAAASPVHKATFKPDIFPGQNPYAYTRTQSPYTSPRIGGF